MTYVIVFIAGLVCGLLLNWRSWKALGVFVDVASKNKEAYAVMKEAYDNMVRVNDIQKANNEKLWELLDPTDTYKRFDADKIRH